MEKASIITRSVSETLPDRLMVRIKKNLVSPDVKKQSTQILQGEHVFKPESKHNPAQIVHVEIHNNPSKPKLFRIKKPLFRSKSISNSKPLRDVETFTRPFVFVKDRTVTRSEIHCHSPSQSKPAIRPLKIIIKERGGKRPENLHRAQSLSKPISRQFDANDSKLKRPENLHRGQSLSDNIRSTLQRKKKNDKNETEFLKKSTEYTILHKTCRKKNPSQHTIAFILKSNLNLAMTQDKIQGYTPLHLATLKSSLSVVKILIESCPKAAEVQDILGRTPLHLACKRGSYNIMKEILNVYPQASYMKDSSGETPLLISLSDKKCESIPLDILKQCPMSALSFDKNGNTPLRRAYNNRKSLLVLKSILKANPKVALIPNKEGECFIDFFFRVYAKSSHYNIYDLTCIFLRASVNAPIQVSRMDDDINVAGSPFRPLHSCALMKCPPPLFRLFLKSCPEQSKVFDANGDLPLHIVLRNLKSQTSKKVHHTILLKSKNFRSKMKKTLVPRPTNRDLIPKNMRASRHNIKGIRPKYRANNIVSEMLTIYPQAAGICDRYGRTPLAVAAGNGLAWNEGLKEIYEAAPRAVLTKDVKSHMHPFMLSAIPCDHGVVANNCKVPRKNKQTKEKELQDLTTTFELLQKSFEHPEVL